MKRLSVYVISLLSPFLIGEDAYGQLPDKPEEGFHNDPNKELVYYLDQIGDTDYFACGCSKLRYPAKARNESENRSEQYIEWGFTRKDFRRFDRDKNRIIDRKEHDELAKKHENDQAML